ncbi:MAG: four helix bundle protein [Burkholderiales bacterium]|nr:four helix bundle protein [Bacteroidia bacterium]
MIYKITENESLKKVSRLKDHIRRASISVISNIAKG